MIFFVTCTKTIVIRPFALGPKLEAEIIERLKTEIEGSLSPIYGYCLFVKTDENKAFLDEGVIDDEGNAVFKVSYSAIYFNLFADEVVDGIVYLVSSNGIRLNVGPIVAFIDQAHIPPDLKLSPQQDAYIDEKNKDIIIKKDSVVRFRVISPPSKTSESEMVVIGTIEDDYLGYHQPRSFNAI